MHTPAAANDNRASIDDQLYWFRNEVEALEPASAIARVRGIEVLIKGRLLDAALTSILNHSRMSPSERKHRRSSRCRMVTEVHETRPLSQ
ncbi:hypothetical protein PAXRUDRAFT_824537 [Paxillus rubicundulus Ve08.2h10]|uniref:Uncharacterized protein n=1 Tax=Paxillus rubicundulus Ve08.2h10 TaxID=930991 RepID=A0A0D0EBL2_9AGAM|nr:hypothetical protein PAXRUDRAFT_824537 [Paxillus rubicundulus Ve08.2h10]